MITVTFGSPDLQGTDPPGSNQFRLTDDSLILVASHAPNESKVGQTHRPWHDVKTALHDLANSVKTALADDTQFPLDKASILLDALSCPALEVLMQATAHGALTKLTFPYELCPLLPEWIPLTKGKGAPVQWLDQHIPLCRTLDHVARTPVRRQSTPSLAILYEDGYIWKQRTDEPEAPVRFSDVANHIARDLHRAGIAAIAFCGGQLSTKEHRSRLLREIFFQHSAVLFFGNMTVGKDGQRAWKLAQNIELPMKEIFDRLKTHSPEISTGFQFVYPSRPAVVFANCCCSAGADIQSSGHPSLSYPKLFLDSGVDYFIGTSMEVVLARGKERTSVKIMQSLISDFFIRWFNNPKQGIEHLYEAKKALGFPLLTGLYQIYTRSGQFAAETRFVSEPESPQVPVEEETPQPHRRQSTGAWVASLHSGDRLDDYRLEEEVWADPWARTFRAIRNNKNYLVQVLVDDWQCGADLQQRLQKILDKLHQADLGTGHLLPIYSKALSLFRSTNNGESGEKLGVLHGLIYAFDNDQTINGWRILTERLPDYRQPSQQRSETYYETVLEWGLEIAMHLAKLHQAGIRHGNLDPNSIIVCNDGEFGKRILIKDAWVSQLHPGRCTENAYVAPEELEPNQNAVEVKNDCWGLGVTLFELASGERPFADDEDTSEGLRHRLRERCHTAHLPEALDNITYACLFPTARSRPSAAEIAERLFMSRIGGGAEAVFLKRFNEMVQAGHHLFHVLTDEPEQLEKQLAMLDKVAFEASRLIQDAQDGALRYTLFTLDEQEGFIQNTRRIQVPDNTPPLIFIERLAFQYPPGFRIVVLIKGNFWWDYGPEVERLLLDHQADPASRLVFVIADVYPRFSHDKLDRALMRWVFPPPTVANLYEHMCECVRAESLPLASPRILVQLAEQFEGRSTSEVKYALRLCYLRHGEINQSAWQILEDTQQQRFQTLGGAARYLSTDKLPERGLIGLPEPLENTLNGWLHSVMIHSHNDQQRKVRRRVLISAPEGCGKTLLAHYLARAVGAPLIKLQPTVLVSTDGIVAEENLRRVLGQASSLGKAVVLVDDFQYLTGMLDDNQLPPLTRGILGRLSRLLLGWLNVLPEGIIAVFCVTANNEIAARSSLPPRWQRRMELYFHLPKPDGMTELDLDYRQKVFQTAFRKHHLKDLANAHEFIENLARRTHPNPVIAPGGTTIPTPLARLTGQQDSASLATCAEIAGWVEDTLILHGPENDPWSESFWWVAIS